MVKWLFWNISVLNIKKQFAELTAKNYAGQARWFLNAFWDKGLKEEAENVYKFYNLFVKLDEKKKKEGNELDEFMSHKFLEDIGETLTVLQLREKLRQIDLDMNKKMAITEYLLFKFNKQVGPLVTAAQGSNKEEMDKAQRLVDEAQAKLSELLEQLENQKKVVN